MVYLDNASTTRPDPACLDEMEPFLSWEYGNPGSRHRMGRFANAALKEGKCRIAKFIGAKSDDIIITSSGTEANNLAVLGIRKYLESIGKPKICISSIEHDSVYKSAMSTGNCVEVGVDINGVVLLNQLDELLSSNQDIGMVSVMYVNNEVGSVNDVNRISEICKKHNVLFHTDCVQAAGTHKIDCEEIGCDFLTISAHKLNAPKGIGVLYARNKELLSPIIHGGSSQEFGLRGGTENVAGVVALGAECNLRDDNFDGIMERISVLKHTFYRELQNKLVSNSASPAVINANSLKSNSKILSMRFNKIDSETLVVLASSKDVFFSSGSACKEKSNTPNRVLLSVGLTEDEARNAVRFSFSDELTTADVIHAANVVAECVLALC